MSFAERKRFFIKELGGRALWKFERYIARKSLIGDAPFFDASLFPWAQELEKNWESIRAELETVLSFRDALPNFQDISPDQIVLTNDDQWKTYFFYGMGYRSEENCVRCPRTTELVEKIPHMTTAFFSILSPRKHIPAHRGLFKGIVRYHLGLKIPDPSSQCRLRIEDQYASWEEGTSLFFDDTFEHEAWNDSDEIRVVLFVDFLRPLRFPAALLNRTLVSIVKQTGYVQDSKKNHERWEKKFSDEPRANSPPSEIQEINEG